MSSEPTWLTQAQRLWSIDLTTAPLRLVDVGAAGAPLPSQAALAAVSEFLGFDPDLRSPQTSGAFGFRKHTTLGRAITAADCDQVTFNLTHYPECSSTLEPDPTVTRRYAIGSYFDVVGCQAVPATTLARALTDAGFAGMDWLKLDTQGTDLDLLQSLPESLLEQVLVVDVEPGVAAFYRNENPFSRMDEFMQAAGFWLADLHQQRFPRVSVEAVSWLGLSQTATERLSRNPFALELQYFRNVENMVAHARPLRDFLSLWLIAMANGHFAYAIEIAVKATQRGLDEPRARALADLALAECERTSAPPLVSRWVRLVQLFVPPIVGKVLRRIRR